MPGQGEEGEAELQGGEEVVLNRGQYHRHMRFRVNAKEAQSSAQSSAQSQAKRSLSALVNMEWFKILGSRKKKK